MYIQCANVGTCTLYMYCIYIIQHMYMYRLYHRLSGYTGNIPEVVTDKARGRSPRALSVTTQGIAQYSQACLWYNLFVAKATGALLNRF